MSFDADSVYWFANVTQEALLAFRKRLLDGDLPELADLKRRGVLGYEYELRPELGLSVEVAPESNLAMGLYVMAGPRWLRPLPPASWEPRLRGLLASWGLESVELRLSRVDPSADVLCKRFPRLKPADVVSRARKRTFHYSGTEALGLSAGNGAVRFRLYDKTEEAADDLDFWCQEWGIDKRKLLKKHVARFEWQLRRDFLKEFGGIQTVDDLLERWGDVMRYLLDWFRLAAREQGHEHERPDLPVWSWLRGVLGELGLGVLGVMRGAFPKRPNVEQLKAQAIGVVASIAGALAFIRREGLSGVSPLDALDWLLEGTDLDGWHQKSCDRYQAVKMACMA